MKEFVLSGGYTIDEHNQKEYIDILIKDKRVIEISKNKIEHINIIDIKEKLIIPGLVDMHTHLRYPGQEHKEDLQSGTKAALKGGYTSIYAMPNTNPVIDNIELLKKINDECEKLDLKITHYASITKSLKTEELTDMENLCHHTSGFSNDGVGVQNLEVMKKAMINAKKVQLPIIAHAEEEKLVKGGVIHMGIQSENLGLPGINSDSEYVQIKRDIKLAEETKVKYHVCHISTWQSVEAIKEAKERKINISCEVTPHHLLLTENDVINVNHKMNPPLRTIADREMLLKGINDGTIDVIATDHAPHSKAEKGEDILTSAFGIIGLENAFSLCYTELVKKNLITLRKLIELMSLNPRKLMNLENPLGLDKAADITIIDEQANEIITQDNIVSKSKNTPFIGKEVYGLTKMVIIDGRIVYERV